MMREQRFSLKSPLFTEAPRSRLTAAVTAIVNERDGSYSLTQETVYRAATNLELRSQLGWIGGARVTDFGERQANLRWEVRARYHF